MSTEVTFPAGVGLKRVGQVLLDAWESDPGTWSGKSLQLREGAEGHGSGRITKGNKGKEERTEG